MSPELDPQPEQQRISDQDVRKVLERAIQLDAARVGETSLAELRRVAQELNITPASLSQALQELQTRQLELPPPSKPIEEPIKSEGRTEKILDWMRMGLIAVGAQIIARSINYADGDDIAAFLSIIAAAGVGSSVFYRLAKKPAETYLRDLAVFWGLFTLTWLMDPPVNREYVFPGNDYIVQGLGIIPLVGSIFSWLASSTVGGFFMRFKWPWKKVDAKQGFAATASLIALIVLPALVGAQRITSPKEQFGHNFGDDYFLANYKQIAEYWHKLDAESDRMIVKEIGKTAEGRPHLMAIVTSPENHRNLARYQNTSLRLGLAEGLTDAQARELAREGKAVVWIDGGLHASESLGAQQLGETVYQMVSGNDEETLRLLNDVIILFVHANPDGNDLIADWYMRRSNPQERQLSGFPKLYQKYIGHDNNRDFFGSTQAETENMSRVLYHEWMPQLLYNHHQSGPAGTVFWSPPLRDPYNYNLHPMLVLGFQSLGAAMHTRMAAEGKPGATMRSGGPYDGWWNGGIRNTAAFHNVIALLTEMVGSPTPMRIPFVAQRQIPGADLAYPIEPQEWHFRQSIDYSVSLNKAVLDYASRFRENLLYNIYVMGKSSIDRGSKDYWTVNPRRMAEVTARLGGGAGGGRGGGGGDANAAAQRDAAIMAELRKPEHRDPRGYIIPSSQPDFPTAVKFVNALREVNVGVHKATRAFEVQGKQYPAGSLVVFTAQAFRPHILDMFEPQHHPDVFPIPGGPPTPPYDNAGWTFALQMGVQFDRILEPFSGPFEKVTDWNLPMPTGIVAGNGAGYLFDRRVNNSFIAMNRLQKANEQVSTLTQPITANGKTYPAGTFYVRSRGNNTRTLVNRIAQELGVNFDASPAPTPAPTPVRAPRIGLWDQFGGSMDAGWARWILEQFEYPFDRVFPQQLDAGNLNAKYDVLVFVGGGIPAAGRGGGAGGGGAAAPPTDIPAEYQSHLGRVSVETTLPQIEQFIRNGGTVVTIGSSAPNLAAFLKLPLEDHLVENGTALPTTKFYVPGSILSARVDTSNPIALGMTEYTSVFFDDSPVFRAGPGITKIAWFDTKTPLQSGWAWGQQYLENGVVAAEAPLGKGKVLFFGPEILKRAQPHPTFKFLFNSILSSGSPARSTTTMEEQSKAGRR